MINKFLNRIKQGVDFDKKVYNEALGIYRKNTGLSSYKEDKNSLLRTKQDKEFNKVLKQVKKVRSGQESAQAIKQNYIKK